ncbi:CHAP domain-containing protein [[Mycobacterium] kokjensenii]|uniref:CHAP domain-containing protein n=1 Tax=[Mycobacterium] kokjensenii TaxID=3064287 RepID=A0ABN9NHR4_9MYCO|nr:CHAP domain-containing protein [Mycolicibacter sp. MU0083]CAJ1505251.1 CHAP domain-containing protein [Mycolicibacter sp. MU0083]
MPGFGAKAAVAAAAFAMLGPFPAAHALPGPPVDPRPVQPVAAASAEPAPLPQRAVEELDIFRGNAAEAALGNPVVYGDGQCYPLVEHYIQSLGWWRNHDPSVNVSDLYHHFPTNGLDRYFDRVPFEGGLNEPRIGDIVVYDPGGVVSEHGHAAVVTDVHGHGPLLQYQTADQNSGGRLFVTLNQRDFSPMWNTLGFLRPKP